MNQSTSYAIWGSMTALAAAVVFGSLIFFGFASATEQAKDHTVRITACVSNGGTWIETTGSCIISGVISK